MSDNKSNDVNYNLFKVCFTYNPYTRLWAGCESEHLNDLWNGVTNKNIVYNEDKNVLIDYFNRGLHINKIEVNEEDDIYYLKK